MLKKRIIPCLDIKEGRTVKGINFIDIRDAGDPVELAKKYVEQRADELVFLDITATIEKRKTFADLVERIAAEINIPFTVGGGVDTIDDLALLLRAGADKVSINSSAFRNPALITQAAKQFGSQCVVIAIDTYFVGNEWVVYIDGGRTQTKVTATDWALKAEKYGAGEILLTSMNADGTKSGFSIEITREISKSLNIPVIASGGAGTMEHFRDVFTKTTCSAALAASIFHYGEISIPELKEYLADKGINIRV
jgi:cyclase